jgi:Lrp/AsnC family leucine-responsive transcriptional regulator
MFGEFRTVRAEFVRSRLPTRGKSASNVRMDLDDFDRRILDILQTDCSRAHADIGAEINLSGSAVRRRIQAMREAGVIAREVAILGDTLAGVTMIVTVALERESREVYEAFGKAMQAENRVQQCYTTAGQFDVVLIVSARDAEDYRGWAEEALLNNGSVRRYDSYAVSSTMKFTTKRPLA